MLMVLKKENDTSTMLSNWIEDKIEVEVDICKITQNSFYIQKVLE